MLSSILRTTLKPRHVATTLRTFSSKPVDLNKGIKGGTFDNTMEPVPNAMTKNLVVTACGPDRKGIVSDTCRIVDDFGGSVGESRAQKLGNHFSIMMLVNTPSNTIQKLTEKLTDTNAINNVKINVYETGMDSEQNQISLLMKQTKESLT